MAKPVSTRALDTMGAMGCVDRVRDDKDRHNVVIKRTVAGALYIEKQAIWSSARDAAYRPEG